MRDDEFDALSKALSTTTSRRQALKLFGATAVGGVMTLVGAGPAAAVGRCKKGGSKCRQNAECCSGFCDPATARCACPAGSNTCSSTGACVTCTGGSVFVASTCRCECPTGTFACGQVCCTNGQACNGGTCCTNPAFCTDSSECCGGFRCEGDLKFPGGPGTCVACVNPPSCKTGAECCSGFICATPTGGGPNICLPAT